jgi:hypothetical protein
MAPIGKYYLGVTPETPLSPNSGGGSANSNGMAALSSSSRNSVQQVAQHTRQPSQPPPQSPPIHIGDVNPIPAPVSNPSSPPLRNSSFFNQIPGTLQGDTPLHRSINAETVVTRIEPLPPSLPSDQEEEEIDSPTTRARGERESRKLTGKMRKDFKFPPPPARDSGLPDIELPGEDQDDVPGTPVTPRTPKTAPPAPAPPSASAPTPAPAPPPPMIVVHAAKDSMNPTPPPKRVDLPEVVLPDPPTPNSEGESTPPGGRFRRLGRRESEDDDLGETVEVDLS